MCLPTVGNNTENSTKYIKHIQIMNDSNSLKKVRPIIVLKFLLETFYFPDQEQASKQNRVTMLSWEDRGHNLERLRWLELVGKRTREEEVTQRKKFHEPNGVSLKLLLSSVFLGLKHPKLGKEQLSKSCRSNIFPGLTSGKRSSCDKTLNTKAFSKHNRRVISY